MRRIKKKLLPWMLALALCLGHAMTVQAAESAIVLTTPDAFEVPFYYGFHDGLMPVKDMNTGKYGYINTAGQMVLPCTYEAAMPFSDGVAHVCLGYSDETGDYVYAFINTAGQVLFSYTEQQDADLEIQFAEGWFGEGWFSEGYRAVRSRTTGKYGFINMAGQLVVECRYEAVKDFSDGLAAVFDSESNRWGYVDAAGNVVIPFQYGAAYPFEDGYAQVQTADGTYRLMLIDKSGRNVIPEGYHYYDDFGNWNTFSRHGGFVLIQDAKQPNGYYYLLNKDGGIIGPVGRLFRDGFSWDDNRLFDPSGRQVFAADTDRSGDYIGDGYFLAHMQAGDGIVDGEGNLTMLPVGVEYSGIYSEGFMAIISRAAGSTGYGFVNMAGQVVVPCTYAEVKPFSGGVAPVKNFEDKWGLVDSTGAEVLPLRYDEIEQVSGATGVFWARDPSGISLIAAPPAYAVNGAQVNFAAQAEVNGALNAGLADESLGVDYRNEITRAQLAGEAVKLYEAASGQAAPAVGDSPFSDVDDPAVTQAKALGLIDGMPDGTFIPDAPVPKEEAAAILSGVSAKVKPEAPAVQAAKFEPEGSKKKTASIEETLATAARILKKVKK